MNTAVWLVSGVGCIALGSWRVLIGLHGFGLIERPVPGHAFGSLPRWMRGSDEFDALRDLLLGLVAVVFGVAFVVQAF